MLRYHFNPATGRTGICKAKPGKCPFLAAGSRHFDTREEAQAAVELFFTESYRSPLGRLSVQVSRIQREIIKRYAKSEDYSEQIPLINERDSLYDLRDLELAKINDGAQIAEVAQVSKKSGARQIVCSKIYQETDTGFVGLRNRIEELEVACPETFKAAIDVSEEWISNLTSEEVRVLLLYTHSPDQALAQRDLLDQTIRKALPLKPTTVFSGLSKYVGNDVISQLSTGIIKLNYPISTSLNPAQANSFMEERIDEKLVAIEIETNVGASMIALSHSAHEFEILLPSGSYEVLEIKNDLKLLWEKDGVGRTANLFVKLRRLP